MREQERRRLVELCNKHDLDPQDYDFEAINDYHTLKLMILKDAGVRTREMEEAELKAWEAMADWMDSRSIEEKIVAAAKDLQRKEKLPPHCLVFIVYRPRVGLATQLINAKFKGNIHRFGIVRRTDRRGRPVGAATIWMVGRKEVTLLILKEMRDHNIHVRVIRNCPYRRDFLHYYMGRFYHLPRSVMKQVTQKIRKH